MNRPNRRNAPSAAPTVPTDSTAAAPRLFPAAFAFGLAATLVPILVSAPEGAIREGDFNPVALLFLFFAFEAVKIKVFNHIKVHRNDLVFFFMTRADCKKKNTDTTEIDRVLQYISDNISAPLTLQTLASVACLSPNYFVRKFTAALGMPPLKYVFTVRMERAKLLIKKGGRISEIMTDLGFTDAAYFSKAFKSYTGFSPRAYRKTLSLQLQD